MSICAFLPEDMVIDILSRLRVKSLCRFKCVSKSWFALISSPNFAKTHLSRNDKPKRVFLISDFLYSIDCTESSNNDEVIAMKLDFPRIKDEDPYLFIEIVASCNGLLLVVLNKRHDYAMYLLNPSTRESKKLPDYDIGVDPSPSRFCMYGLGYDSSMDDYKVVAVSYYAQFREDEESDCKDTFVVVHSLKTSSWGRKWIQDFPYEYSNHLPFINSGVFVNGSIHWFTYRSLDHSPVIVAFDVADEKFRDVLLPTSLEPSGLGVLGGCLFYKAWDICHHFDLWVMKEYGVTESWTKFTIYKPNNAFCLESLDNNEVLLNLYEDEELSENRLVIYNTTEKRMRYIMVDGNIPLKSNDSSYCCKSAVTYVESIVSPYFHYGIDRKELSTMTHTSLAHNSRLMPPLDQLIPTDEEKKVMIL